MITLCCPHCDAPAPGVWVRDQECPACGDYLLADCAGISPEVVRACHDTGDLIDADGATRHEDCPGVAEPLDMRCSHCAGIEDGYWDTIP